MRTNFFRSLLVVALLCVATAFFSLSNPTAHAATSLSSSTIEALRKAGYTQVKSHNSTQSPVAHKTASHITNNAAVGPYQFSDNIYSLANSNYVATELGATGGNYAMLRARTSGSPGPWEAYDWYAGTNGAYVIQSHANSLFVTAELGATGGNYAMLRARTNSNSIGPWEQFDLFTLNGCNPVVANCQSVLLSAANNQLVAAELGATGGNYGMLRARTGGNPGPWEQFTV